MAGVSSIRIKRITSIEILIVLPTGVQFMSKDAASIPIVFEKPDENNETINTSIDPLANKPGKYFSPKDRADVSILDYDRENIKFVYPELISAVFEAVDQDKIDWTKYAYLLYATSTQYFCNALMIMAELKKFGSKAERVIMAREEFLNKTNELYQSDLLQRAEKYGITVRPVQVRRKASGYWTSSFTKLLVFNELEYERIIYMDSDAILTRGHMDELFFLPPAHLASVLAYWLIPEKYVKDGKPVYNAEEYNFKPLTKEERSSKIQNILQEEIKPWIDSNGKLPLISQDYKVENKVKERNFYNNLYNSLPSNPFISELFFS